MGLFQSVGNSAISISGKEFALIDAIKMRPSVGVCASDICAILAQQNGKEPRLATVYGALLDLEKKGLVEANGTSNPSHGGRPRRLYRLTATGRQALQVGTSIAECSNSLLPAV